MICQIRILWEPRNYLGLRELKKFSIVRVRGSLPEMIENVAIDPVHEFRIEKIVKYQKALLLEFSLLFRVVY